MYFHVYLVPRRFEETDHYPVEREKEVNSKEPQECQFSHIFL